MRDPLGFVDASSEAVFRYLYQPLPSTHFLNLSAATKLVNSGNLTPFEILSSKLIKSRKVAFVTYPYEWTHSQLLDAAKCTLNVMESALEAGFEIKDASAFNVIFQGARPEFCDHTSFEPIKGRYWWGYGQFLRHFLMPLAASRFSRMSVSDAFKSSLDGITLDRARALLGTQRWWHRIAFAFLQSSVQIKHVTKTQNSSMCIKNSSHLGLIHFLRWQLDGLARPIDSNSYWVNYEYTRTHYTAQGLLSKKSIIERWLSNIKPHTVLDLGCNKGEFSLLASDHAKAIIALDADEASIENLRRRASIVGAPIQTVLASLDDPSPPRGWTGDEFASLIDRLEGKADVVLALALLHHLVLGCSIPIEHIVSLLARLTRKILIVELIWPDDEKVQQISESRNRQDAAKIFTIERQLAGLTAHFSKIEIQQIEDSNRILVLMQKKTL